MPVRHSPDLRIKELDKLFQNTHHYPEGYTFDGYQGYWTKKDLAEEITRIFELKNTISTKTIENDLKKMEIDYHAPLDKNYVHIKAYTEDGQVKNVNKIAYFYYDTSINIFNNNNLEKDDLKNLRTIIAMLEQFKGFKHFEDVSNFIDNLKIKTSKNTHPKIFFETVDNFSGIDKIDIIAKAVREKFALLIKYKSFQDDTAIELTIHPYQLREFNNRWFVLASTKEYPERKLGIYGLGRLVGIPKKVKDKYKNIGGDEIDNYFKNIIGVTNFLDRKVLNVEFEVFGTRADYVLTKPWHETQKLKSENPNSKTFIIKVKKNNELIAKILEFGDDIKVIKPKEIKLEISNKLSTALQYYTK